MSASHILSIPWDITIINDVSKLLKYYTNMMVLFSDTHSGMWVLSIQSNNKVQQLSNSNNLTNTATNYMYLRNGSGATFGTFINQSLQVVGASIDDTAAAENTVFSSTKMTELFTNLQINMFQILQTGDIMYDDYFKYFTKKDTSGKIEFTITGLNSSFTDKQIDFISTYNSYNVVSLSDVLNLSAGTSDSDIYSITSNIVSIKNSLNYLTNTSNSIVLENVEVLDNCFNGLNIIPTLPNSITSISNCFNNINAPTSTFTIQDSSIYNISTCFISSSFNVFITEDPILVDVSNNFTGNTEYIIVMSDIASKPTHSTASVISIEQITTFLINDVEYSQSDLEDVKEYITTNDVVCSYDSSANILTITF